MTAGNLRSSSKLSCEVVHHLVVVIASVTLHMLEGHKLVLIDKAIQPDPEIDILIPLALTIRSAKDDILAI